MFDDKDILTVEELASFLRMNERTVYKLANEGKIPAVKIASQWRFKKSRINEWLDQQMGNSINGEIAKAESNDVEVPDFNFNDFLNLRHFNLELKAHDRLAVLWELVECLVESGKVKDPSALFKEIQQREQLMSTGLEEGVAFPHPRKADATLLKEPILVIGRSKWGVDFGAMDNKPTRLFFLIGAPNDSTQLKILARINRLLKLTSLREDLLHVNSPQEALELIKDKNASLSINKVLKEAANG